MSRLRRCDTGLTRAHSEVKKGLGVLIDRKIRVQRCARIDLAGDPAGVVVRKGLGSLQEAKLAQFLDQILFA